MVLPAAIARAAEPVLLIETRVGERPVEMDVYLHHVAKARGERPLLHGAQLAARIATAVGSVPRDATDDEAQALTRTVSAGHDSFMQGDFGQAIRTLEKVAADLASRDALLGRDRRARLALERARLMLCHAYLRTGRPRDAAVVMAEAIRAAPGKEPSLRTYSPELVSFYRRVRSDLDGQQRGTLRLLTRPEGATVFLGGEHVGRTPVRVPDLFPGRYRVVAQGPGSQGRVHEVAVASGEQELVIDLELEAALGTEERPVLTYPDADTRARFEAAHAAALGRALGAREVVLVGVGTQQERPALIGAVVSVDTARILRAGFVVLEPASPDRGVLDSFGRFLRVGAPGPGVVVQVASPTGGGSEAKPPGRSLTWLRWAGLAVGLAAVGTGAGLLAVDGRPTCGGPPGVNCQKHLETTVPGALLVAAGGALALTAGVAFLLRWGERPRLAVAPLSGGALLSFAGGF